MAVDIYYADEADVAAAIESALGDANLTLEALNASLFGKVTARAAASSSPRLSSGRPCASSARMPLPRARWVARRSSTDFSNALKATLHEGPLTRSPA
jgi:hypothetical protein